MENLPNGRFFYLLGMAEAELIVKAKHVQLR